MLLDIRANEISQLRKSTRTLSTILDELKKNAQANDRILRALHKVALLLIEKPTDWQTQATQLVTKEFALQDCRLIVFTPDNMALAKTASRLPTGGKGMSSPIAGSGEVRGAKRYLYLPLKKNRRATGLLVFASKQTNAFPDSEARDFSRRLAELFAAAL